MMIDNLEHIDPEARQLRSTLAEKANPIETARWFLQSAEPTAQRARQATKAIIIIALFVVLFWIVPIQDVLTALITAEPVYLLAGLLLSLPVSYLTAVELAILVRKQGITHGIGKVFVINMAVKFYTLVTPGTIVGSGVRWYRLAQPGNKVAEALAALAFFRLLETFMSIAFGLAFWLLSGQGTVTSVIWLIALFLVSLVFWLVATRLSSKISDWFKALAGRAPNHPFWQGMLRRVERFLTAIAAYTSLSAWDLFLTFCAGLGSLLVNVWSSVYLARSVGVELSFLQMGGISSLILLASQLPFAVAGGLGIREASLVAILPAYGASVERALAFSFLLFIRGVVLSLFGGAMEAYDAFQARRVA